MKQAKFKQRINSENDEGNKYSCLMVAGLVKHKCA